MITDFLNTLAAVEAPPEIYNQYQGNAEASKWRRANLRHYLEQMRERQPAYMLVGEAAGHRGCRLTGVPFTSEAILLAGIPSHKLLGEARGYRKTEEKKGTIGEATATIVWEALGEARSVPLLWNALPFHPHRPGEPWSNRTPRQTELLLGVPFLHALLRLFPIKSVIAVGNKADRILEKEGIAHHKIRHPSHGGKSDFRRGLHALLSA
jgi:uracil-DNA glycosylase